MNKFLLITLAFFGCFSLALNAQEVISDWETAETTIEVFSFGTSAMDPGVIANPVMDAVNGSSMVYQWCEDENSQTWAGFNIVQESIDFTGTIATVCISMLAESDVTLRLKLYESTTGGDDIRLEQTYNTPGAWQQLCFDFTQDGINGNNALGNVYTKIAFYQNFPTLATEETCYQFDDLTIDSNPPTPLVEGEVVYDWETDETSADVGFSFNNGHFGDSIFMSVPNPNMSGINTSDNVYTWCKGADGQAWAGFVFDPGPDNPFDFTGEDATVCMNVLMDHVGTVKMKIEGAQDGAQAVTHDADYTTPNEWQQVCFDFTQPDGDDNVGTGHVFDRLTLFFDFGEIPEDRCYWFDDIIKIDGPVAEATPIISDYEPDGITVDMVSSFGNGHYGADLFDVVANPSPDAVNGSSLVQNWCKANDAMTWGGWTLGAIDTLDFTGTQATICLDFYADEASLLRLKLEGSPTGEDLRIDQNYTTPGEWQELCFDFAQADVNGNVGLGHQYDRIVFFPDFPDVPAADKCYYFDNIYKITNGGGSVLELIGNIIQGSADHTILTSLITSADMWNLVNADDVTVFAPTDAAFNALPAGQLDNLMNNIDNVLINTLLHHVTYGALPTADMAMDMHFIMRNGQDGVVTAANTAVNNANISEGDIQGTNGLLQITDAVLEFPADPDYYTHFDYESPEMSPEWTWFGTQNNIPSTFIVDNPNPSGINTSPTVVMHKRFPDPSQWWQGTFINLDRPFNFVNGYYEACVDVYAETDMAFRMKLEDSPTGANPDGLRYSAQAGTTNEWVQVCMDVREADLVNNEVGDGNIFNKFVVFIDVEGGSPTAPADTMTYYFDNLITRGMTVDVNTISELKNFRYYPNPTSDFLTIKSDTPIATAVVYDMAGREVIRTNDPVANKIDVAELTTGMYFINFHDETGVWQGSIKFVKE